MRGLYITFYYDKFGLPMSNTRTGESPRGTHPTRIAPPPLDLRDLLHERCSLRLDIAARRGLGLLRDAQSSAYFGGRFGRHIIYSCFAADLCGDGAQFWDEIF